MAGLASLVWWLGSGLAGHGGLRHAADSLAGLAWTAWSGTSGQDAPGDAGQGTVSMVWPARSVGRVRSGLLGVVRHCTARLAGFCGAKAGLVLVVGVCPGRHGWHAHRVGAGSGS